jgi:hypothetical protein
LGEILRFAFAIRGTVGPSHPSSMPV